MSLTINIGHLDPNQRANLKTASVWMVSPIEEASSRLSFFNSWEFAAGDLSNPIATDTTIIPKMDPLISSTPLFFPKFSREKINVGFGQSSGPGTKRP